MQKLAGFGEKWQDLKIFLATRLCLYEGKVREIW